MSSPITESDSFPDTIQEPDILDVDYPNVVRAQGADLASRTRYLLNALTHGAVVLDNTNTTVLDAGSYSVPDSARQPILYNLAYQLISTIRFIRQFVWGGNGGITFLRVPLVPYVESDGTGNYQVPGSTTILGAQYWNSWGASNAPYWYQLTSSPTNPTSLHWTVPWMPPAGHIVSFSCDIQGETGHVGLPGTMPTLTMYREDPTGVSTAIATISDTSGNTSQYQNRHSLVVTNLNTQIEPNCAYHFKFTGEAGANKLNGLILYNCRIAIGP